MTKPMANQQAEMQAAAVNPSSGLLPKGPRFGPAGNSESFAAQGYKKIEQVPAYLSIMGLTAYEYQCGRGVRVNEAAVARLGALAATANIALSLHAPYYISLSSVEEEKRRNSVDYILQAARAAQQMGATRVVVHTGSCSKMSREQALALAMEAMGWALQALDAEGLSHMRICPETMGKINQLGTLQEVLALCQMDERLLPCIDFGHLNARTGGGMNSAQAFAEALNAVEAALGQSRLREFHSHFSKIEYTAGGEKRHLTFADEIYGPDFPPLAEQIYKRGLAPVFICESAGTQAEDAATMKTIFEEAMRL